MAIDSGEYKARIGLDKLYIAEVTADSLSDYTAEAPAYFAPAAEASQEPAQNSETLYADDQAFDVMDSEGETAITLTVTNIPLEILAKITGRVFDATNGMLYDNGAVAPYFALMFRSLKSNGSYRYYAFLKGRFNVPSEAATTKGDTPEPQLIEVTYRAVKTIYKWQLAHGIEDGVKRIVGDEDTAGFDATTWFTTVPEPAYEGSS